LLAGAFLDGEVTDKKKELIEQMRVQHKISHSDHSNILKELGWSAEEYVDGIKGSGKADVMRKYFELLKHELSETPLAEDARKRLIQFRHEHAISSDTHYRLIKKLSWTPDDYELGFRQDGLDSDVPPISVQTNGKILDTKNTLSPSVSTNREEEKDNNNHTEILSNLTHSSSNNQVDIGDIRDNKQSTILSIYAFLKSYF